MDCVHLLNLVLDIGGELLENGAETYRVEDTMRRIVWAYGIEDTDGFVVPTCIITSITPREGPSVSKTRRIRSRRIDLNRVDRINALCRSVCQNPVPLEELETRLREIQSEKPYPSWVRIFGAALLGLGFTLFFGGTLLDAVFGTIIASSAQLLAILLERLRSNPIFVNIIGGGLIMLMALLFAQALPLHLDKMVIGALMVLVPGVALTNSMRDLIAGDYMAGQTRLVEALLTATAIALGAGAVLGLVRLI